MDGESWGKNQRRRKIQTIGNKSRREPQNTTALLRDGQKGVEEKRRGVRREEVNLDLIRVFNAVSEINICATKLPDMIFCPSYWMFLMRCFHALNLTQECSRCLEELEYTNKEVLFSCFQLLLPPNDVHNFQIQKEVFFTVWDYLCWSWRSVIRSRLVHRITSENTGLLLTEMES